MIATIETMRRTGLATAAVMLILATRVTTGQMIIDDHFDDGNIETGGVNGGFVLAGNAQDTDVFLSEERSIATIEMLPIQSWGNKGMVSISSFDATSLPEFTATFVVDSVSEHPAANGQFLGITDDGESFYRSIENFGLVFFGQEARTNSSEGFGLVVNDIGDPGAEFILDSDLLDLESYLDGFTATFTVGLDGWSYEITDVDDIDLNATTFRNEGTWSDVGLDDTFYTDFFDDEEYVTVSAQTNNFELIHAYDRITLQSGDVGDQPRLQPGDADQDLDFDQLDLVRVQIAAKYLSGQPATWGEGDWDGGPGGTPGNPPPGDGQFNQLDIIAALAAGVYLTGPYHAMGPGFANVARVGLAEDVRRDGLTGVDSLAGGGALGGADLIYVPEPAAASLLAFGSIVLWLGSSRNRGRRSVV